MINKFESTRVAVAASNYGRRIQRHDNQIRTFIEPMRGIGVGMPLYTQKDWAAQNAYYECHALAQTDDSDQIDPNTV